MSYRLTVIRTDVDTALLEHLVSGYTKEVYAYKVRAPELTVCAISTCIILCVLDQLDQQG